MLLYFETSLLYDVIEPFRCLSTEILCSVASFLLLQTKKKGKKRFVVFSVKCMDGHLKGSELFIHMFYFFSLTIRNIRTICC